MNRAMTPEKRQAILAMWRDDKPLTEIMFVLHVSAPTVRKIAKDAGLFPRDSDAERQRSWREKCETHVAEDELERRKLEVQAKWSDSERNRANQYHRPATVRCYRAKGYGLEEVA